MNYQKLMLFNPTIYGTMINSKKQEITFVEHPTRGDEYPVIAICHKLKLAATTDFYELDDMMTKDGEYEPWFNEIGELKIG